MCTPAIFRRLFAELPSPNFGLNFDPSHYVWQGLDYVQTVYEFKDKIFHVHFKDIKLYPDKLKQVGVLAYPLEYMSPKLPGLGDVDWGAFISALHDIRYNGNAVIEVEDKAFESCKEDVLKSIRLSKRYLLDKKLYWIPEENLCQTRRSPQSIMEIYGQGLQRSMAQILPGRLKDFYQGIV